MYDCIGLWTYITWRISRVIAKQTTFNFVTFNITGTLRNYFTRELLLDDLCMVTSASMQKN